MRPHPSEPKRDLSQLTPHEHAYQLQWKSSNGGALRAHVYSMVAQGIDLAPVLEDLLRSGRLAPLMMVLQDMPEVLLHDPAMSTSLWLGAVHYNEEQLALALLERLPLEILNAKLPTCCGALESACFNGNDTLLLAMLHKGVDARVSFESGGDLVSFMKQRLSASRSDVEVGHLNAIMERMLDQTWKIVNLAQQEDQESKSNAALRPRF